MDKLPIIVAIDFDETITMFPYTDKDLQLNDIARIWIQRLHDLGCYIIIWTCRGSHRDIQEMIDFLNKKHIPFDNVNDNHPSLPFHTSRKIYYDFLIDDKAFFDNNWERVFTTINLTVKLREKKETYESI